MKLRPIAVFLLLAGALTGALAYRSQHRPPQTSPAAVADVPAIASPATQALPPKLPQAQDTAAPDGGDCTLVAHYLPNGDGTTTEAYTCERATEIAPHPYEQYSNEALASLAYSDAKAAEILGMRMRDRDEALAMSLMIRASALADGDVRPLVQYFNAYPHPSSVDGVPVPETVRTQFVLLSVMGLLNPTPYDLSRWEDRIRNFADDPEYEIASLTRRAEQIVEEMRQIQLEVTGETNLGG